MTTTFVGSHSEVTGSTVTKYYFAGTQRVAMRSGSTLSYLLTDHLGSTSITTDANGTLVSELRYKPWGETRYTSGVTPTNYTYTGQYSNMGDFGLMFYNARWYDPALGRFAQADTIIPGGIQGLDRYAYVNNSPINFIDPSGHFSEGAIKGYLFSHCLGNGNEEDMKQVKKANQCATSIMTIWKADEDWWDMITTAEAGDILVGTNNGERFLYQFTGEGQSTLSGITPYHGEGNSTTTLNGIQRSNSKNCANIYVSCRIADYKEPVYIWAGLVRFDQNHMPSLWTRPGGTLTQTTTQPWAYWGTQLVVAGWFTAVTPGGSLAQAVSTVLGVAVDASNVVNDPLNIEPTDINVCFGNFQCATFQPMLPNPDTGDPGGGYDIE